MLILFSLSLCKYIVIDDTYLMNGWRLECFVKAENLRVTLTTQCFVEFSLLGVKYLRVDTAN